jgi:N-methylhydantoinase B
MKIDPIRFEVVRSALVQVTEEMAAALRKSAYSTNIKTRMDFSCAFFDRDVRPIAQSFAQPVHLGSFVELLPRAVRAYGTDNMASGDMYVTNDPYGGGSHLNDVTVFAPVFYPAETPSPAKRGQARGAPRLIGYVAALAHHVDVGGGAPASIGPFQEVFQEGIIIPPVKLVDRGEVFDDVFRLILAQIRSKRITAGDFRAQIAANKAGIRRLQELVGRTGLEEFHSYVDALIDYTKRRTRAEISRLPKGTYEAEGFLDNDGFTDRVVKLKVRITIDRDGVLFDLTGCDPQRRAPVNSTYAMTFSACAYALRALMDKDLPVNHGFYQFVRLNAPRGTVVNAVHPGAVVGGWETQIRVNDLMFKALSQALPEAVPAGCKAMMAQAGFGVIDRVTGEYHCNYEALAGGYGGRAHKDGPDAVQGHGQNTENAPVEEIEGAYPVMITRLELIDDSDGAGRFRGGLGLRRDYHFPHDPATFTILSDRDRVGPWGLFGGMPGRKAFYVLNPDREARQLSSKCVVQLKPGDTLSFQTPGGGGYGPPGDRDPALVLRDVRDRKVSAARAHDVYRVAVLPGSSGVNAGATARLRSQHRGRNGGNGA